ncbi:MAG: glutamate-5-semialdehyde dehydrogenase [Candidatus Synoicihabitans palmerolidicus]|nr:glutamate-5-semialdehyde dehydrogenase [Candidatus Synoicihabitans palmerolidicus]
MLVIVLSNSALSDLFERIVVFIHPASGQMDASFRSLFDLHASPIAIPLTLVVMGPITEELIFRALILGGLLRTTSPRKAILISATLFSAIHLNLAQMPATLMVGIVFGWVYYHTRSLSLCIFGHAVHNALAMLVTAHALNQDASTLTTIDSDNLAIAASTYVLAAIILGAGLWAMRRITPTPISEIPPPLPLPVPAPMPPLPITPPEKPFALASEICGHAPLMSVDLADLADLVTSIAQRARTASYVLATAPTTPKNAALLKLAELLPSAAERIFAANQKDLDAAASLGMKPAQIDRLTLTPARLAQLAESVRQVSALPDPVGAALETTTRPNGLIIEKRRVPIGVIGIIYEARPNVTIDCAILCLKSGNAAILRGGKEIFQTNTAFAALISEALSAAGLPADAVQLIPTTDRAALNTLLKLNDLIHCIIPRGGEGLIRFVAQNSTIPVIKHYTGVCFVYLDQAADSALAESVTINSKIQRPGVCNAAEQLLVHRAAATQILPTVARGLVAAGVELRCDTASSAILAAADIAHQPTTPEDLTAEFLALTMGVQIVDSLESAISIINRDSSGHSETIITADATAASRFQAAVDSSAVFWNASTRFNDGFEFGFGAEIGISTDRLHARGPMGLPELCSYKYVVTGTGQTRS